jgi:hypothetical protein
MTQKVFNGFPQYFSYTYQTGKFFGSAITQANEALTIINLQSDLIGDSITLDINDIGLITVIRDGAVLLEDQGFELVGPNTIAVWPGLLETEVLQIKKLVAASGIVEIIPVVPPVTGSGGYPQDIIEATVYTDNFKPAINAFPATLFAAKTRITTQFFLNEGRIDLYLNNTRVSINDGIWEIIDSTTIELNDDYSATRMKVDIIKQKVG